MLMQNNSGVYDPTNEVHGIKLGPGTVGNISDRSHKRNASGVMGSGGCC